jgi:hypothetical protein
MLTDSELEILKLAKEANPHWFVAIMRAANIMADRRRKYSGDEHPYWNFVDMSERTGLSMMQVFDFYVHIKRSRQVITEGQDFADESFLDSLIDELNYVAIKAGWFVDGIRKEDVIDGNSDQWAKVWPIITLDFDGVLNKYDGWKGYYAHFDPRDDAIQFLRALKKFGYYIVVTTARPDDNLWTVQEWLERHDMAQYVDLVTNKKVPSQVYFDDRAVQFFGDYLPDYILDLYRFKAYWQTDDNTDDPTAEQLQRINDETLDED